MVPECARGLGDEELQRILTEEAKQVPKQLRPADGPSANRYDFEVGEEEAAIRCGERVFFDHVSPTGRHFWSLEYVGDLQPSYYTPMHQCLHERYAHRYEKYVSDPGRFFIPTDGDVAVDAGAYVGHKAIALHDAMSDNACVVAIEFMLENYLLLEKNIWHNGLNRRVVSHPYPLSSGRSTELRASTRSKSPANTLAYAERFEDVERERVETFTLADVLNVSRPDRVDYLNVQVNGAELDVLRGLGGWMGKIYRFYVACPYAGEGGIPSQGKIKSYLLDSGVRIKYEKKGLVVGENVLSKRGRGWDF